MYSYPVRCRVWLLVIVAMIGGGATVWPQSRNLPDAPGTWKPWKPLADTGGARKDQAFTPALMKAFEGELLVLNAILRRAPGVTTPVGFSVETWGHLAGYHVSAHAPGQPAGAAMPIAGGLTFGAFPIFEYERNGKMVRQDTGETALQQFLVNQIGRGAINKGNVLEWGPVDTDAFLQPLPQGEIAGLPRYGDALVIARDPAALIRWCGPTTATSTRRCRGRRRRSSSSPVSPAVSTPRTSTTSRPTHGRLRGAAPIAP